MKGENWMFKIVVIFIHVLIFLLATIIGLGGVYNPAPPDPSRTFEV